MNHIALNEIDLLRELYCNAMDQRALAARADTIDDASDELWSLGILYNQQLDAITAYYDSLKKS